MTRKVDEYLDPDFDPRKVTISSLCSILASNGVDLPAVKHKKQFYVDLFEEQLRPFCDQILREKENIIPSNEGIIIMGSEQTVELDNDENSVIIELEDPAIRNSKLPIASTTLELAPIEMKRKASFSGSEKPDFATPVKLPENSKRVKISAEILRSPVPLNPLKFKKPPTPAQVLNAEFSRNTPPSSEIKPPTAERFMVPPVLPGIRRNISGEHLSVKELVKQFEPAKSTEECNEKTPNDEFNSEFNYEELVDESERPSEKAEHTFSLMIFIIIFTFAFVISYFYDDLINFLPAELKTSIKRMVGKLNELVVNIEYLKFDKLQEMYSKVEERFHDLWNTSISWAGKFLDGQGDMKEVMKYITNMVQAISQHIGSLFVRFQESANNVKDIFTPYLIEISDWIMNIVEDSPLQSFIFFIKNHLEVGFEKAGELLKLISVYFSEHFKIDLVSTYSKLELMIKNWLEIISSSLLSIAEGVQNNGIGFIVTSLKNSLPQEVQLSIGGILVVSGISLMAVSMVFGILKDTFEQFCAFGKGKSNTSINDVESMDNARFAKFCKDTGVVKGKVTITDVDIVFNKVKTKGARKIDYNQFVEALTELAKKKGLTLSALEEEIHKSGGVPSLANTTAVSTDNITARLTDTQNYTGTHKERFDENGQGKGLDGRRQQGVINNMGAEITNRKQADVRGVQL